MKAPTMIQGIQWACDCNCSTCSPGQNHECDRAVGEAYAELDAEEARENKEDPKEN